MEASFNLLLVDLNEELCQEWRKAFSDFPEVSVHHGPFQSVPEYDCLVAAGNSFGLMHGGVDLAILNHFGHQIMETVQDRIERVYLGEQPPGTCLILETGEPEHPFLAYAPTMRLPCLVAETEVAYQAMWAVLVAVHQHNLAGTNPQIEKLLIPGLGTGTGRMPVEEAARQMAVAYSCYRKGPHRHDWLSAEEKDRQIRQA